MLDIVDRIVDTSPTRRRGPDGASLRSIALALAEAGAPDAALSLVNRMGPPYPPGLDRVFVQVAAAAAHVEAADVEAAKAILTEVVTRLDFNRDFMLEWFVRSSAHSRLAEMLTHMGAALAQVGEPETAREMFLEAATAASRIEEYGSPSALTEAWERFSPDPDVLGLYRGPDGFDQLVEAVSGDRWPTPTRDRDGQTYARGATLRQIACSARAADIPVPMDILRDAAVAGADRRELSIAGWVLRAVALALVERPCPN